LVLAVQRSVDPLQVDFDSHPAVAKADNTQRSSSAAAAQQQRGRFLLARGSCGIVSRIIVAALA
jgi:hypothetical protein